MAPRKPSMAFRFLDLNEDCQRMMIRQLLLENEAKIMTLADTWDAGYVLKARRPEANNRLGMVCKAVHVLFEDEAHRLRVFDLDSEGWDRKLEESMKIWSETVDLGQIRFLRLILGYEDSIFGPIFQFRSEIISQKMKKSVAEACKFLNQVPRLEELELVVATDPDRLDRNAVWQFRRFLFDELTHHLDGSRSLAAVHTHLVETRHGVAKALEKCTMRKTASGWFKDGRLYLDCLNASQRPQRFKTEVEKLGRQVEWKLPK